MRGLTQGISDTYCVGDRGKAIRSKAWPLLKFNVKGADVDVSRCTYIEAAARCKLEVCEGCRKWVGPRLEFEAADTEQHLGVGLKTLVVQFITRPQKERVFADIVRCDDGNVYIAFDTEMLPDIVVAVDGDTL